MRVNSMHGANCSVKSVLENMFIAKQYHAWALLQ